ncbi:MAG: HAD family hydrolase [Anaerolineales bacterium]|jgi:HAD superfamily hydrolase (TIGR01509 family)
MTNGLDIPRIKAICFDLDGTLVETDDAIVARLVSMLRPFAFLSPERDLRALARQIVMFGETPVNRVLAFLDRTHLDNALAPLLGALHRMRGESTPREIKVVPGVLPMLQALQPRYPLALVTTRDQSSTHQILEETGLAPLFRCVATARTRRRTKPHPAPLLWAARRLGVDPEACLMVGDTTVDIRAGAAAKAQTVGVLCGFGERQELLSAGACLILESPASLARILLQS